MYKQKKIRLKFVWKRKNIKIARMIRNHDIYIYIFVVNALPHCASLFCKKTVSVKEAFHKISLNFVVYFDK